MNVENINKNKKDTSNIHKKQRTKGKKHIYSSVIRKCGSCSKKTYMNRTCLACMKKATNRNRKNRKFNPKINRKCIICKCTKPSMNFNYYFLSTKTRDLFKSKKIKRHECDDCIIKEFYDEYDTINYDSDYEVSEIFDNMNTFINLNEGNMTENIILSIAGIY